MTARSSRSLLLAGAGVAALTLFPVASAAGVDTAFAVLGQDTAEETAAPGDDAAVTSPPRGGEPTEDAPVDEGPVEEEPDDGEDTGGAPEDGGGAVEGDDAWDEDLGDPSDPALWEALLSDEGFVGVSCTVDDSGYEAYELTQEAPEGSDWLLAVLISDTGEDEAWFDVVIEPWVGDQLTLEGEEGELLPLTRVILCRADLEASPVDPGDLDPGDVVGGGDGSAGGGGATVGVGDGGQGVVGPVVETDVPARGPGAGAFIGLGALVLATGTLVAGRRGAPRR